MSAVMSIGTITVVGMLAFGAVAAGGAAVTAQRMSAAADAAALAGADTAAGFASGEPCDAAAHVAAAHGATVADCGVVGTTVSVRVYAVFAGFDVSAAARAGVPATSSGGAQSGWSKPSDGEITSEFGPREAQCDDSGCASTVHQGVDFSAGCGAPIYAIRSGVVVSAAQSGGYGNQVRIDHGDGLVSGYAHIVDDGMLVAVGDTVITGQLIALEGDTGQSFGCHVHVSLERGGAFIDPMTVLG